MPYVPGSPIDAFCAVCNKDTVHTVLDAAGLQVRFARCTRCNTEGPYRSPKSKYRAAAAAATAGRPRARAGTKTGAPRKSHAKQTPEELYREVLSGRSPSDARPYNIHEALGLGALVNHPTFGVGVVVEMPEAQKARIRFSDGDKLLACNRA